jgi:dTMP kinase
MRGRFIVVDGPSGVGKTTICEALANALPGDVLHTAQPSKGPVGQLARHGTADFGGKALALLVAADRAHQWAAEINPALAEGRTVVCDRYVPSSLVLQTLDGVDPVYLRQINAFAAAPDLTVILTGDPDRCAERAARRGGYSRFHRLTADDRRREHDLYREVARQWADMGRKVLHHHVGAEPPEQVVAAILPHIPSRP